MREAEMKITFLDVVGTVVGMLNVLPYLILTKDLF